jgi:uncharacterized membrane protein
MWWYDVLMDFFKHFVTAAAIFVAIDAVWLTAIAGKFYKKELGSLLAPKANLKPAAVFYALYIVGMVVFAINPALRQHSLSYVIKYAALLGLTMYATYDLTNASTLKNWPAKVTYVDMAWGTTITTVVSTLTFLIFN